MYRSYNEYVEKFLQNYKPITIQADYYNKIEKFVEKLVIAKQEETHHKIDSFNQTKRFMTGFLGEAALEKMLGIDIIDWSIGDSKEYHHPDIPGYKVGIKTVEYGKFPIVFKNNYYPQILCIRNKRQKDLIYVCGLATTQILNEYQDDDLIIDKNLRARGTKTGFYGYEFLLPVTSLQDISDFKKV